MLLVAIFGIFWRTTKTNASINHLRVINEQHLVAQATLQDLFSKVNHSTSINPYFYIEKDSRSGLASLIFTIDGDTQKLPEFCGYPLIKLYVEDEQLVVATFPHSQTQTGIPTLMRKDALLSNVTDFEVEVFLADEGQQETKQDAEDAPKKPPMGRWTDIWLKEYDRPPTLVKLHVTRGKSDTSTLWFFITPMITTILYDKE